MDKNNKKSNNDLPQMLDFEELTRAYAQSLDKVTFGGKAILESKKEKMKYVESDEKSSPEHEQIIEKIKERNRILSKSIWTDEPVLKPQKSVWLDDEMEIDKKRKAQPSVKMENDENSDVLIPIMAEINKKPVKSEVTINIPTKKAVKNAGQSAVPKAVPRKKNFTVNIPETYYKEYEKGVGTASRPLVREELPKKKPQPPKPRTEQELYADAVKSAEYARQVKKNVSRAKSATSGKISQDTQTRSGQVPRMGALDRSALNEASEKVISKPVVGKSSKKKVEEKNLGYNSHELEFSFVNASMCILAFLGIFVILLCMKRESGFIDSENRNLAEFPTFSISSYFSGDYTQDITTYFTDTVPKRESLKKFCSTFSNYLGVKMNDTVVLGSMKVVEKEKLDSEKIATTTTVTAFTGKITTTTKDKTETTTKKTTKATTTKDKNEKVEVPENLDDGAWEGNVIVSGSGENVRAMGAYYGTFENGTYYAQTINKWKEDLGDTVNVYNMSIPTSSAYYMPKNLADTVSDQKDNIDNIASGLKGIINVDVYNTLASHVDEYIYSRTDHHWQPLGAYYASTVFAQKAGLAPFPTLKTYEKNVIEGFCGTMYGYSNNNQELADNPDTFTYYKPDNDYTVTYYDTAFQNGYEDGLFFDYASGVNCYSAILNVDSQIVEIETDCDNGRVLVVFKDSFGNALIPYFTHNFSKIYVCDFRYFDINAITFCKDVGCTDLLFAISLTSCSTPSKVDSIDYIRTQ